MKMKSKGSSEYIDLSEKWGDQPMPIEIKSEGVHYPTLYFSGKNGLKELPESGQAMIKYKKVMERTEKITRDGKSETRYVVELEIHGIRACENEEMEDEMEDESPSDEDAIEMGLEEASSEPETEEEEEND